MKQTTANNSKEAEFMLTGKLWKVMFSLSWPSVIAMTLYGLNSVLDLWFIGRFAGEAAVAGVSVIYPVTLIALALGSMAGAGGGAVLSLALGAEDRPAQRRLFGNINTVTMLVSLAFTAFAFSRAGHLARLMGGTDDILPVAVTYLRISALGAFFWIDGLAVNMLIRAEGRMKRAALIMGAGLGVNALANYILMGPLGLGVAGAAWGTNIAMFVYVLLGWLYFGSGRASFKTRVFVFHADRPCISAYKIYTATAILLCLPCYLVTMAAPAVVLGLMLPGQLFTATQTAYCRIYMAALPLVSIVFMAMTLFPTIGKGAPAAALGIARQGLLYIPLVLLLPRLFGVGAVYYGSLAVDILLVIAAVILVKREFSKLRKLQSSE